MTGRYATETGVWHNATNIDPSLPTLAGEFRKAGYSANMIGKWHLAPGTEAEGGGRGYVKPEFRGGFLDLWEGANEFEWTTHPYEGTIFDRDGKEITFKDEYRVDFVTDRAERFLKEKHDRPFLLYISQLEPHFQNDEKRFIGPKGSAERFHDPCVPNDLKPLPGNWQSQLPDYYGCVEAIDKSVGRIFAGAGRAEADGEHDCCLHKRSWLPLHDAERGVQAKPAQQLDSDAADRAGAGIQQRDDADGDRGQHQSDADTAGCCGSAVPASVKGRSVMPMLTKPEARKAWPNKELVQISEAMTARALRTKDWTYCVIDAQGRRSEKFSDKYVEYQMYSQAADPFEQVNLAGRQEFRATATELRAELKKMMEAAGEPPVEIEAVRHYP